MRTDDLIHALAADGLKPARFGARDVALALGAGFAVSAVAFWLTLGPREDIREAMATIRFDFKILVMLVLAATCAVLTLRLAIPGQATRTAWLIALLAPAMLAVAVAMEMIVVHAPQWLTELVGSNSLDCLISIPLLSLPLLAAMLWALRRGAPTRPGLTGAVAGIAAGGLGAALYAVQCTDDSPLFVATWYSLALVIVGLLGACIGQRVLRW